MPLMMAKRLVVWLIETLCEVLAVSVLLIVLSGRSENRGLADDVLLAIWGTALVFMVGSGYLLTTAAFGVLWRSINPWVYPAISAALFVIHVQFFATGWDPSTKVPVQLGGAGIVFGFAFLGTWLLRTWVAAGSPLTGLR
ncbi:MAG: hypothetical protein ACK532_09395 [Acidobacteriota bacterium]|jgi:hypothetical protein